MKSRVALFVIVGILLITPTVLAQEDGEGSLLGVLLVLGLPILLVYLFIVSGGSTSQTESSSKPTEFEGKVVGDTLLITHEGSEEVNDGKLWIRYPIEDGGDTFREEKFEEETETTIDLGNTPLKKGKIEIRYGKDGDGLQTVEEIDIREITGTSADGSRDVHGRECPRCRESISESDAYCSNCSKDLT